MTDAAYVSGVLAQAGSECAGVMALVFLTLVVPAVVGALRRQR